MEIRQAVAVAAGIQVDLIAVEVVLAGGQRDGAPGGVGEAGADIPARAEVVGQRQVQVVAAVVVGREDFVVIDPGHFHVGLRQGVAGKAGQATFALAQVELQAVGLGLALPELGGQVLVEEQLGVVGKFGQVF